MADAQLKAVAQEWEAMMDTFKVALEQRVSEELNPMVYPQVRRPLSYLRNFVRDVPVAYMGRFSYHTWDVYFLFDHTRYDFFFHNQRLYARRRFFVLPCFFITAGPHIVSASPHTATLPC